MSSIFKRTLLTGTFACLFVGQVFAHAHLASAVPAAGSVVKTSPTELDLKFEEDIDLKFSGVKVIGPKNAAVATGAATMAKGADTTLVVPITTPLVVGDYVVSWHNLSKDGHKTKGTYKFTVKP
jgi:copper resistance protein C